jgi:hypothetical protein
MTPTTPTETPDQCAARLRQELDALTARHEAAGRRQLQLEPEFNAAARADDQPWLARLDQENAALERERAELAKQIERKTLALDHAKRVLAAAQRQAQIKRIVGHARNAAKLAPAARDRLTAGFAALGECTAEGRAAAAATDSGDRRGMLDAIDGPGLARFIVVSCINVAGLTIEDFLQAARAPFGDGRDPVETTQNLVTMSETIR